MIYHRSSGAGTRNLPIYGSAIGYLYTKRYPRIHLTLVENHIRRGSSAVVPGDENDVFHLYPHIEELREGEPRVYMPNYPFGKKSLSESILMPSFHRKIQDSTVLLCARKRDVL